MIDEIKKTPIFSTIIVSVAVALIAGGTSPWWWKEYIVKSETGIAETQKQEPLALSISGEIKAKREKELLEAELKAERLKQKKLKEQLASRLEPEQKAQKAIDKKSDFSKVSSNKMEISKSFSGIYGRARLDWSVSGIVHRALIQTQGSNGMIAVEFYNPFLGCNVAVRQNLELKYYQNNWFYVGSDPVWVHNGQPAFEYSPDSFRMEKSLTGGIVIVEVFDSNGVRRPVSTRAMR